MLLHIIMHFNFTLYNSQFHLFQIVLSFITFYVFIEVMLPSEK
jgi:hypothetical protein